MSFGIRNYDYPNLAPWPLTGAARFDNDVLYFSRGASVCGEALITDNDGRPWPMLCICTAPERAWAAGNTAPFETWILFEGRAGLRVACRIARWLLRGDPSAPLRVTGPIHIYAGAQHAGYACWKVLAAALPDLIEPLPSAKAVPAAAEEVL